jgi:hypothetical protein
MSIALDLKLDYSTPIESRFDTKTKQTLRSFNDIFRRNIMKTLTATAIVSAASACVTSLIFVGIVNVATTTQVEASPAPIQTVTVRHARMTEAEKLAYDQETSMMQTVVISAKRLTPEQKAAMSAE